VPTVVAPRKKGRFIRKSMAQRIKELDAKGMRNSEIAKALGIRPQNVYRALHRDDREVKRVKVDWSPERLAEARLGACEDLCQTAQSDLCECPCEGANHGIANHLPGALEALQYRDPNAQLAKLAN
jgi:DNA-binding Lrp family transcriptional regulator